jgi:peptidoglycan/LPS O-acetylase OafA/YrhL
VKIEKSTYLTTQHFNNFNLIRFIAAIMVWYDHCYGVEERPIPYLHFMPGLSLGSLSVSIFFVISGYFITASYTNQKKNWLYIKNRILRIFPAFVVLILLSVFLLGPTTTSLPLQEYFSNPHTWRYFRSLFWVFPMQYELPGVFLDLPHHIVNGSLWTLHPEFWLYCELALCGIFGLLRPRAAILIILILWCCRFYGLLADNDIVSHISLLSRWSWGQVELSLHWSILFATGGLFYLTKEHIPSSKTLIISCTLVFIGTTLVHSEISTLLCDLVLPYIVIYLGFVKLPWPYIFKSEDFSYGIYLYAYPIQQLTIHVWRQVNFSAFMAISLILTFICAIFSWYCIEKPALAFKKRPKIIAI